MAQAVTVFTLLPHSVLFQFKPKEGMTKNVLTLKLTFNWLKKLVFLYSRVGAGVASKFLPGVGAATA
jgi:hypothetical protein